MYVFPFQELLNFKVPANCLKHTLKELVTTDICILTLKDLNFLPYILKTDFKQSISTKIL